MPCDHSDREAPAASPQPAPALLHRVKELGRRPLQFALDDQPATALEGDTVLTAVLTQRNRLRHNEFSDEARAGFCLMGACQDCWMRLESGDSIRACSTLLQAGMRLLTQRTAA